MDNPTKGPNLDRNAAGHEDLYSASNRLVNWQQTLRLFRQTDKFNVDRDGHKCRLERTALQDALTPARKLELDAEHEKHTHMVINGEVACEPSRLVQCYNRFSGVDHVSGGGSYFDFAQKHREDRAAEYKAAGKLPDIDDEVVRMPSVTECSDTMMGLSAVFGAIDDIREDTRQRRERDRLMAERAEKAAQERKKESERQRLQRALQDAQADGESPKFGRR